MHRELSEVLSNEYSIVSDLGEDTLSMVSTVSSEPEGEDKKSCACTFIFWGAFIGLCGIIGISRKAFQKSLKFKFRVPTNSIKTKILFSVGKIIFQFLFNGNIPEIG